MTGENVAEDPAGPPVGVHAVRAGAGARRAGGRVLPRSSSRPRRIDGAADYPKLLWFADASHEEAPLIISSAPMPPVAEFARRGGRFGAHNLHENEPFDWSWTIEDVVFGSFFNGGVRAFDVRNPFQLAEVGALVPGAPAGSAAGAIQINDVYVDSDGIVYAVDRGGGGLYIAQFSPF